MQVIWLFQICGNGTYTAVDDTIIDLWGVGPNRPPIDTHHPAVITHPVTGLKALNITNGFVTGFAELKKKESGMKECSSWLYLS